MHLPTHAHSGRKKELNTKIAKLRQSKDKDHFCSHQILQIYTLFRYKNRQQPGVEVVLRLRPAKTKTVPKLKIYKRFPLDYFVREVVPHLGRDFIVSQEPLGKAETALICFCRY